MTPILRAPFRTISIVLAGLSVAAILTLAPATPAEAGPRGWHKGHGYDHGHHHRKWRRYKRMRRHHYRHHHKHRHAHRHDNHAPTGGRFLNGISGGNIIGGLLGAAAGTQIGKGSGRVVAVLGGTVLGAVLGGEIEKYVTARDHRQAQRTLENVPSGQSVTWRNPDSGLDYTVTPTRTYQIAGGRYCRDYSTWVFIDGYEERAHGTACRQPDGTWATAVR